MKSTIVSIVTLFIGITGSVQAQNLLVNADFSGGNSGFTSAFTYSPGNLLPTGVYDVVANPEFDNPYGAYFGDHTTGSGLMLAVNNSDHSTAVVWSEVVNVASGTQYQFSGWGASWAYYNVPIDLSPALLRISINGVPQGVDSQLPANDGQWLNFGAVWNSGASTQAIIQILDVNNLPPGGNAFTLDDLSLQAVPEPSSIALFGLVAGVIASRRLRNPATRQ